MTGFIDIPVCGQTAAEVIDNGLYFGLNSLGVWSNYAGISSGIAYGCYYSYSESNYQFMFLSNTVLQALVAETNGSTKNLITQQDINMPYSNIYYYYQGTLIPSAYIVSEIPIYNSRNEALEAFAAGVSSHPITYRLTNCTAPSAPTEATVGDTVTVPFQFTSGYGIVNPSSDLYVTNNGVVVPSQYSNGVLTFTMPDPS